MTVREQLSDHLAALDQPALTALLTQRPDALRGPEPRDLTELAQRLSHPTSLVVVLSQLPLPCLQMAEALAALGADASPRRLVSFLDDTHASEAGHEQDVHTTLSELYAVSVAWPGGQDRVHVPGDLGPLFGAPLQLGPPLAGLLQASTVQQLQAVQTALGLKQGRTKAEVTAELLAHLSRPDTVRSIVEGAPPEVRAELLNRAKGSDPFGGDDELDPDDDEFLDDDGPDSFLTLSVGSFGAVRYDPDAVSRYMEAARWASVRGIMFGSEWSYEWTMPAEVALALRGPDYRAPFVPQPPTPMTTEVGPTAVESESAVAATAFANHALAILDRLDRTPLATLKAGGVGARELTRLAKATGSSETEARLVIELALAAGLLDSAGADVGLSEAFAAWRAQDPGPRFVRLLAAWWGLGRTPSEARDRDGKTIPAVLPQADCPGCRGARAALVQAAARLAPDQASDRASLAAALVWHRPLVHGAVQDGEDTFATLWREAELLGVLSLRTLSRLGRLLAEGDEEDLAAQASRLLPQSSDRASFGADLTAMVVGAPSAAVSSLLDSTADRESRGGAIIWRLSPASIRRALDDGTTGADLEQALASISSGELPQPLRYLVADVARRHGLLRLSPAVSMIRSDDTALLAEVAVDKKLAKLGLRLLAPTVLACEVPVDQVLSALRAAGYFPMPERDALTASQPDGIPAERSATGGARPRVDLARQVVVLSDRVAGPGTRSEPMDPARLAARLAGKQRKGLTVAPSLTEAKLAGLNRRLSEAEIRLLAHAIDHGRSAVIDYEAASGRRSTREISDIQLVNGSLYAQCELRQDERVFTVVRIQSVSPAP